jgi:hypothetical protein
MDATGHGEQPPDLYLPPARTPTPEASSSDWAATRHATRSPERVVLAPVLDAAPAHAHDPLVGAGELRAASADHVSGQAACDIRPSPSHPTDQPSDDLPVQFEDSERWPAPVTPATLREGARQASSRADRADAPVVAAASPATSDDDTDTPSDPLPPDLDQVGIETGLGGVWYLVNLLVDLWPDDPDVEPVDAWSVLRDLATALLDGEPPDPVWSIFDYLIGHAAAEALPTSTAVGRDVGAQRSGGGVFLLHRSLAWLADAGFPPDDVPGLLRQPARLFVTRTHIDLIFRLDQIDLRARLAGLDRDPGWVPALGHVISFQYR